MTSNLDPSLGGQLLSSVDVDKTRILTALTTVRDELSALQEAMESVQTALALVGGGDTGGGVISSAENLVLTGLTTVLGGVKSTVYSGVSGSLSMEQHAGAMVAINGDVVLPATGGFSVWLFNETVGTNLNVTRVGGVTTHVMLPKEYALVIAIGQSNVILFPVATTGKVQL